MRFNHFFSPKVYAFFGLFLLGLLLSQDIAAQRVALKTNAIDWLTMTPNLTLEGRVSRRVSL